MYKHKHKHKHKSTPIRIHFFTQIHKYNLYTPNHGNLHLKIITLSHPNQTSC
ncbi:hypothetical protein HanRHA438_Chr02g0048841 [Helianthus annuus]|nr:hypothetical protein HanRHA438_Chr02g0048841 [Helianthus annuus]